LSLRGAQRRSNLVFGNKPFRGNDKLCHVIFVLTVMVVLAPQNGHFD